MAFGLFKKKETFADRIFYNAHVYTMDRNMPWVEAVAVKDGDILAVGNYDGMEALIGDDTEVVDLEGKYMLPGFIDIHHSPVMKMMEANYSMNEEEEQQAEEAEAENIFASLDHAAVYEYLDDEEDEAEEEAETVEAEAGEIVLLEEDVEEIKEAVEESGEEYDPEAEYFLDNSEFNDKVAEAIADLSDHGFTTVLDLRTPNERENEFEDSLIEFLTEGNLGIRFLGALFVGRPVPARLIKEVMSLRRTKCVELGDMIKNEVLYILLDSESGKPFPQKDLDDIAVECADRNFMIFFDTVTHEDLLKAYRTVDFVRNKGYRNNIIIASDEGLTDKEYGELSAADSAFETWRSDVMGRSYFEGAITDIEEAIEHLTIESAELLGMEDVLGSIEKGKHADFAIFSENPLDVRAGDLYKLYCDMTVVDGEIVHDVDRENDEFMLNMMMYER